MCFGLFGLLPFMFGCKLMSCLEADTHWSLLLCLLSHMSSLFASFFCFVFSPNSVSNHLSPIHPSLVSPQKSSGRGELLLSLCYQSTTNTLTVVVLKARNLPKTENNGPTGTCTFKWTFYDAIHGITAYTNT